MVYIMDQFQAKTQIMDRYRTPFIWNGKNGEVQPQLLKLSVILRRQDLFQLILKQVILPLEAALQLRSIIWLNPIQLL